MKSLHKLLLTIVIGSAVFVGGFFYYHDNTSAPQHTNTTDNVPTTDEQQTILPEFVEVYEKDGQRRLKNTRDGYDITLESNWRPEYYTNVVTVITDDQVPSGEMTASFDIIDNQRYEKDIKEIVNLRLERYNDDCPDCYRVDEFVVVSGLDAVFIRDFAGMGERYLTIFATQNRVYEIFSANLSKEDIIDIIKNTNFD